MALGTSRPRNWGKEAQQTALSLLLDRAGLVYRTTKTRRGLALWLARTNGKITLPFLGTCAELQNVERNKWVSTDPINGEEIAKGVSERDVIRATIQTMYRPS